MKRSALAIFGSFLALLFQLSLSAETSTIWGKLNPGPHAAGFKVLFEYDASRPYKREADYWGKKIEGERRRPLQINIWYPAAPSSGTPIVFQDYLLLTAREENFAEAPPEQKQRVFAAFKNQWARDADEQTVSKVLNTQTGAFRDAKPAAGKFPLVIIAPSTRLSSPVGNAILAEYLATHGFVVASTPAIGLLGRQLFFDPLGTITQMQDIQFVIGKMKSAPEVDPVKLALIGFSAGGLPTSLIAMYNPEVDALVSLESAAANQFGHSALFQNPLYEPRRLTVPLLHFTTQETNEGTDDSFIRAVKYSTVRTVKLKGMRPTDFSSYSLVTAILPQPASQQQQSPSPATPGKGYETICQYTAQFLKAHINKDSKALEYLERKPEENGIPAGLALVEVRPGLKTPPAEEDFLKILNEQGLAAAKAIYQEVTKADPEYPLFDSQSLVNLAAPLVEQKKTKEAIELLNFNAEAHPTSNETFELLGTIYMNEGNKELAIENFTRLLDLDPNNQNAAEMLKKLNP